MTVRVYLVRHGRTMLQNTRRVQGWVDSPLTLQGIKQAKWCGLGMADISFDAIYTSDSGRARRTAELILAAKEQEAHYETRESLREICFGDFDGGHMVDRKMVCSRHIFGFDDVERLNKELKAGEITPQQMMDATYFYDKSGYAESYAGVKERAERSIIDIFERAAEKGHEHILVVSHPVTILTLLETFGRELPADQRLETMYDAAVFELIMDDSQIVIDRLSEIDWIQRGKDRK